MTDVVQDANLEVNQHGLSACSNCRLADKREQTGGTAFLRLAEMSDCSRGVRPRKVI